jgi:hypothetical protein
MTRPHARHTERTDTRLPRPTVGRATVTDAVLVALAPLVATATVLGALTAPLVTVATLAAVALAVHAARQAAPVVAPRLRPTTATAGDGQA